MQIGEFRVEFLNDAIIHNDAGGLFGLVPRALWSHYMPYDVHNRVPLCHTVLYLHAHGQHILIDTGIGTKLSDKQRGFWSIEGEDGVTRGLRALGITPQEITMVICTHLHFDHIGGGTRWADEHRTEAVPTYPNARYVVQRREYEDARHPNERTSATYQTINYDALFASGQFHYVDGNTELLPGITGIVTPGHTPGHMSVHLHSNDEHLLFVSDMASYAIHFEKLGWMTSFDVEPLITLETKRHWKQWAMVHQALVVFPHDLYRTVCRAQTSDVGALDLAPVFAFAPMPELLRQA